MKLNLLPTYVSKEGAHRTFIVLGVVLLLLSIAGAFLLVKTSSDTLATALDASKEPENNYKQALAYSALADKVILQATDSDKHLKLAAAMANHNTAYTRVYRAVLEHVPGFMRVRSISAIPNGSNSATVTLVGVIGSYQQYADAVMALLRIKGINPQPTGAPVVAAAPAAPATGAAPAAPAAAGAPAMFKAVNVTRSGYQINDRYVPALNQQDQLGTPILPGEANLPSDPNERQAAIIAQAQAQPDPYAFQGVGNFGTTGTDRDVMPGMSEVTFIIQLDGVNLQAPDPRGTVLSGGGGGGGAATSAAGFRMGGPTGPPPGVSIGGGAPPAAAAGAGASRGAGRGGDDID